MRNAAVHQTALCGAAIFLLAGSLSFQAQAQGYQRHAHTAGQTIREEIRGDGMGSRFDALEVVPEAEEALREAMALTSRGEHEAAHVIYHKLAESYPAPGIPALGRFLRLTKNEEELAKFVASLESDNSSHSPLTRARGLIAAGSQEKASDLLRRAPDVVDGSSPAATLLLGRIYGMRNMPDAREEILFQALTSADQPDAVAFLFRDLIGNEHLRLNDSPTSFALIMNAGVASALPTRSSLVETIDPIIINFQRRPGYFARRIRLLEEDGATGVGAAWFTTRLLVREERFEEALAYLDPIEKQLREDENWGILAEEKAQLYRNLGRMEEARNYLEILARREDSARPAIIKDAARAAITSGYFDDAIAHLNKIDINSLNVDDRRILWNLYLVAAIKKKDFDLLLDAYAKATERAISLDFADYDRIIFDLIYDTEDHWAIEALVRARFTNNPENTPPNLWRLAAAAAQEARKKPNQVEALYQWAQARPDSLVPLQELTEVALPLAKELSQAEPGELSEAHQREADNINIITEQALKEMARSQPLDPTAYAYLIVLYESWGEENIGAKIEAINCPGAKDARVLGVAAFALAINGHPDHALGLYERALEMDPRNMDIRMNRAACLTRLDRWDEALAIYKSAWEKGYNERPYHVHEMLERVWSGYSHLDRKDEAIAYFAEAIGRIPERWREESLRDVANLLSNTGHLDQARPYFLRLIAETESPQLKRQAYESLANMYFKIEDYDQAMLWLDKAAEDFSHDEAVYVDLRQSKAEALLKSGKQDETLAILLELARKHDRHQPALSGLFRAAQIAEELDRHEEARNLYQEFLRSESNDFLRRRQTEEKLSQM